MQPEILVNCSRSERGNTLDYLLCFPFHLSEAEARDVITSVYTELQGHRLTPALIMWGVASTTIKFVLKENVAFTVLCTLTHKYHPAYTLRMEEEFTVREYNLLKRRLWRTT